MLLFAGCHCAVLFRGRTNRKAAAVSLPPPPDSGSSGLSVQLPQGSISPRWRTHWIRPGGTRTHSRTLKKSALAQPRRRLPPTLRPDDSEETSPWVFSRRSLHTDHEPFFQLQMNRKCWEFSFKASLWRQTVYREPLLSLFYLQFTVKLNSSRTDR